MKAQLVAVMLACIGVVGCASTPDFESLEIVEAHNIDDVKGCKLVARHLTDSSMFSMENAEAGVYNAMADIKDQAAERRATHVLRTNTTAGIFNTRVYADAYDCAK
jgi:hypothetical protein